MRPLFTTAHAASRGVTESALRWGMRKGRWRRVARGVYAEGPEPPTPLDLARAEVLAAGGVAVGALAGVLHDLDGVALGADRHHRRGVPPGRVVTIAGVPCTDGLQTVVDLAAVVGDIAWEQALETALRKQLTTVAAVEGWLPEMGRTRTPGVARIRRVLGLRPAGAPPTESMLETLMVQLARKVPGLPPPVRQLIVLDEHGQFVARVDLAWPALGLFVELDGEHHAGQPLYDARRETAVVAATGWLCGRFTWTEVVRTPKSTARRLAAVAERALERPAAGA